MIRKWKENEDMFNVQMKLLENMKNEQKMIMNKLLTGNEGTDVRSVCDVSGAVKETNACWAKRSRAAAARGGTTTTTNTDTESTTTADSTTTVATKRSTAETAETRTTKTTKTRKTTNNI